MSNKIESIVLSYDGECEYIDFVEWLAERHKCKVLMDLSTDEPTRVNGEENVDFVERELRVFQGLDYAEDVYVIGDSSLPEKGGITDEEIEKIGPKVVDFLDKILGQTNGGDCFGCDNYGHCSLARGTNKLIVEHADTLECENYVENMVIPLFALIKNHCKYFRKTPEKQ